MKEDYIVLDSNVVIIVYCKYVHYSYFKNYFSLIYKGKYIKTRIFMADFEWNSLSPLFWHFSEVVGPKYFKKISYCIAWFNICKRSMQTCMITGKMRAQRFCKYFLRLFDSDIWFFVSNYYKLMVRVL